MSARIARPKRQSLLSSLSSLIPAGTHSFFFVYSPAQRALLWHSENSLEVLGIRPNMLTGAGNFLLHAVHSSDRFRLLSAVDEAISGRRNLDLVYKWLRESKVVSLYARAKLVTSRKMDLLVGSICDVTNFAPGLHLNELPLGDLISNPDEGLLILDAELRITLVGSNWSILSFKFGDPDFKLGALRSGALLADLFSNPDSFSFVEGQISRSRDSLLLPIPFSFTDNGINCLGEVVSVISSDGVIATRISAHREDLEMTSMTMRSSPSSLEREIQLASGKQLDHLVLNAFTSASLLSDLKGLSPAISPIVESLLQTLDRAHLLCSAVVARPDLQEIDLNEVLILTLEKIAQVVPSKREHSISLANEPTIVTVTGDTFKLVCSIFSKLLQLEPNCPISISVISASPRSGRLNSCIRVELPNFPSHSISEVVSLREVFASHLSACGVKCQISSRQDTIRFDLVFLSPREISQPVSTSSKAIVIDDDQIVGDTLRQLFLEVGQEAIFCKSAKIAIPIIMRDPESTALVLVDAIMDDMPGVDVVRELRGLGFKGKIYGITGSPSEEDSLLSAGVDAVLFKPIDITAIRNLVSNRDLRDKALCS